MGNGWGAMVAWQMSMARPDRVRAMVILSMPFMPRNPSAKPIAHFRSLYGDDYYVCKFQVIRISIRTRSLPFQVIRLW